MTTLGRTGIRTSRIGLGAWGLGNTASHPAVQVLDEEAIAAQLRTAFDLGITLLDSAEVYENEPQLGRIISGLDNAPADLVVSTKFGHGKGFSAGQIRDSVERSLAAFGIERIPLFMVHDPRDDDDLAVIRAADGALPELHRLQDEGLVESIGMATGTLAPLQRAVESDEFDVIQFPRLYTLLNDAATSSGLLEKAKAKDIGTILTSPFTGNILGTGVRGVDAPLYSFWDAQPEVVEAVGRMQDIADAAGVSLPRAAMSYALAEPLIDVVVIGVTSPDELREDAAALSDPVPAAVLARLADAGRVDPWLIGGPEFVWPFPTERMPAVIKEKLGL
ncbi:aldo/keto reductase [Microbacterium thalassium]|uniref:D-threo-aldose 1-dehydrogenase n=1 Tax=Microbacterium thalassium TaxID=362649 RepID=A0A7X0KU01_9MICO|nr:aldo/keto reductase [Microbacterium thalassium]MBB6390647.1 D-threo-aldose 1-dehydrogenase [Microbacterium thalassium]